MKESDVTVGPETFSKRLRDDICYDLTVWYVGRRALSRGLADVFQHDDTERHTTFTITKRSQVKGRFKEGIDYTVDAIPA